MKAIQIDHYAKEIHTVLRELPVPEVGSHDVLVRVKAAAVNPLELLILTGSLKALSPYKMPLTLGNECAGVVERVGSAVTAFLPGDAVYARLPAGRMGAFAEYAAIDERALAKLPAGYDFLTAAAIPLAGLTAYQALTEELEAKPGQTVFLAGGSGSFGQMAVPLAKALGLRVAVSGNARAKAAVLAAGADLYFDYRTENYWETLSGVDGVIDTLGPDAFEHEWSILKPGGRLVSLRGLPNLAFARRHRMPAARRLLFALAGAKYDLAAKRQGKSYRFLFVRADGAQLKRVTELVEAHAIRPQTDPRVFSLEQANDALRLVANGPTDGKVLLRV